MAPKIGVSVISVNFTPVSFAMPIRAEGFPAGFRSLMKYETLGLRLGRFRDLDENSVSNRCTTIRT